TGTPNHNRDGRLAMESANCSDHDLAPFDVKAMWDEVRSAYEKLAEIGTKLENLQLSAEVIHKQATLNDEYNRLQGKWELAFSKFIDTQTKRTDRCGPRMIHS